jgi:hypothetical protein
VRAHLLGGGAVAAGLAWLVLTNGCAATRPAGSVNCLDVGNTTRSYFPSLTADKTAQWLSRRLCQIHAPSYGEEDRRSAPLRLRCLFDESFNPVFTLVSLSSDDCLLRRVEWHDDSPGAGTTQAAVAIPACRDLVRSLIAEVVNDDRRASVGWTETDTDGGTVTVTPVDGALWTVEWCDHTGQHVSWADSDKVAGVVPLTSRACANLLQRASRTP